MPCHDESNPQAGEQPARRPNYFEGQLLSVGDLREEQAYEIGKHRLHNRALHGWGVIDGLEVGGDEGGGSEVVVSPGVAVDPCGREVVVPTSVRLDLSPTGSSGWETAQIVLRYREVAVDPTVTGDPARIVEGYELAVAPSETGPAKEERDVVLAEVERASGGSGVVLRPYTRRVAARAADLMEVVRSLEARLAVLEHRIADGA
jgi:hypothetical protein